MNDEGAAVTAALPAAAASVTPPPPATRALRELPTPVDTATSSPPPPSTTTTLPADTAPAAARTPTVAATVGMPAAATALPAFAEFVFGTSVEGRDLRGYRIGTGETVVLLVGAVHGGFEANAAALIELLAAHFRDNPADVLPGVTLLLVPALNPDGLARGRVLDGRFNANRVDLNRNWGCGWSETAYFRDQIVSAGAQPFSEPETAALAALIETMRPGAALFYHAAADGVFAGECGGDAGSAALGEAYGLAAGYSFGAGFSRYPVTGTAPAWANSLGIPAADVELASSTDPEFDRNLRGVMAVQYWLLSR